MKPGLAPVPVRVVLDRTLLRRVGVGIVALLLTLAFQIASLTSLGRMLDAITATRPELVAAGESFGGALRLIRVFAMIAVVGTTVGVSLWKRALPLGDLLDRVVMTLIASTLGTSFLILVIDAATTGQLRTGRWGVADLPLVLLDMVFAGGLLFVAMRRAAWLNNVRRGLDKQWSIEPLRNRVDELLPRLAEQERGDGVLARMVPGERAPWEAEVPMVAIPTARLDYVDGRKPWDRHRVRGGLFVLNVLFAISVAVSVAFVGKQPPHDTLLASASESLDVKGLAIPEEINGAPRIVKNDGTASAIGGSPFRTNVTQLAADGSCLLDRDGQIYCRKVDTPGYIQVKNIINAAAVSSRGLRGCAILPGGEVRCWRDPSDDKMVPMHSPAEAHTVRHLPPENVVAVGDTFACGVSIDRKTRCWEPDGEPYLVENVNDAQAVAVAATHACAVQKDNTVVCWGMSAFGATLGLQQPTPSAATITAGIPMTATAIPGVTGAVQLALGATHSCARTSEGNVLCWGFLTSDTWDRGVRELPLSPARMIASSDGVVCALKSDRASCLDER